MSEETNGFPSVAEQILATMRRHMVQPKMGVVCCTRPDCEALVRHFDELKARIAELEAEQEILVWNLAGCSTYAAGHGLEGGHDKTMARTALDDVLKMAQEFAAEKAAHQQSKACIAELRGALAKGQENCDAEYTRLKREHNLARLEWGGRLRQYREVAAKAEVALGVAEIALRHGLMMEPCDPFQRGKIISVGLELVRSTVAQLEAQKGQP